MSNNQPRMAENYEIISAFRIGDKEVVFGRDLNCDKPYFCGLYTKENIICYKKSAFELEDGCYYRWGKCNVNER